MVEVVVRFSLKHILINPYIGVGGGLNKSYGGKMATEIGIGTPGGGISPIGYGFDVKGE